MSPQGGHPVAVQVHMAPAGTVVHRHYILLVIYFCFERVLHLLCTPNSQWQAPPRGSSTWTTPADQLASPVSGGSRGYLCNSGVPLQVVSMAKQPKKDMAIARVCCLGRGCRTSGLVCSPPQCDVHSTVEPAACKAVNCLQSAPDAEAAPAGTSAAAHEGSAKQLHWWRCPGNTFLSRVKLKTFETLTETDKTVNLGQFGSSCYMIARSLTLVRHGRIQVVSPCNCLTHSNHLGITGPFPK
jgi:hypothetical protein